MQRASSIVRAFTRAPLRLTTNIGTRRMVSTGAAFPALRMSSMTRASALPSVMVTVARPMTFSRPSISFVQKRTFMDEGQQEGGHQEFRSYDPAVAQERAEKKARTIYVGNLSPSTTEDQLHSYFSPMGNINEVRLQWADKDNGLHRGYGFIEFATPEEAQKISQQKDHSLDGNALTVNMLGKRTFDVENTIHVGNLPFNVNKEELQSLFQTCGEIVSVRIPIFQDTGRTRGFAYIKFTTPEGKSAAMAMTNAELGGRVLRVAEATMRSDDRTRPQQRRYDSSSRFTTDRSYSGGSYGGGRSERGYGGERGGYGGDRSERGGYGGDRSERGGYGGERSERGGYGGERSYGGSRGGRGGRGRNSRNDFDEQEEDF